MARMMDSVRRQRQCLASVTNRQRPWPSPARDRKSTRLNFSHSQISYAVFCLKKKKNRSSHPFVRHSSQLPLNLYHPSTCSSAANTGDDAGTPIHILYLFSPNEVSRLVCDMPT